MTPAKRWIGSHPAVWAGAALLGLLLICYGNSFQASWQYDDFNNIVDNPAVHMTHWSWPAFKQAVTAGLDFQLVSRPLAYLTFALNYWVGGTQVLGYHIVNVAIHWLAALFLFGLVRGTLVLPVFQGRYQARATLIALLSAALWACHPIQVSAVTIIVQRMASMAGMFYILSLYLFLVGRRSSAGTQQVAAYIGCGLATISALLTKENSILLLYTLVGYDLVFFKPINRKTVGTAILIALGITLGVGALAFVYADPFNLLEPYPNRPWTMAERLLTQPRVLFIYLSLLAVPGTSRMSILHDVAISHSLVDPWTTGPAIVGLAALVLFFLWLTPRHRLFGFCGLFFFFNHLMESSILNLELIYEHRNYIPSMLVFVPFMVAAIRSFNYFFYKRSLKFTVGVVVALLFGSYSITTYNYNKIYKSEWTLWTHASIIAPKMSLPHVNLVEFYWNLGKNQLTFKECKAALEKNRFNDLNQLSIAYYNLGLYEFRVEKKYQNALINFKAALGINPKTLLYWYNTAKTYMFLGKYSSALDILSKALAIWPNNIDLLSLQSVAYVRVGKCNMAIQTASKVLKVDHESRIPLMVLAQAAICQNDLTRSLSLWRKFNYLEPKNLYGIFALIELSEKMYDINSLSGYTTKLSEMIANKDIRQIILSAIEESGVIPYVPNYDLITSILIGSDEQK